MKPPPDNQQWDETAEDRARRLRQAHAQSLLHLRHRRTHIEPLSVRDRQRRDRWHTAGQWLLVFLTVFTFTLIGLLGSWDRQRMGERPTAAQERAEERR